MFNFEFEEQSLQIIGNDDKRSKTSVEILGFEESKVASQDKPDFKQFFKKRYSMDSEERKIASSIGESADFMNMGVFMEDDDVDLNKSIDQDLEESIIGKGKKPLIEKKPVITKKTNLIKKRSPLKNQARLNDTSFIPNYENKRASAFWK